MGTLLSGKMWAAHDFSPVALIRDPIQQTKFTALGVPSVVGDLEAGIAEFLPGMDAVVFTAGSGVLEDKALAHIAFAGPGVAIQKARDGVRELLSRIGKYQLEEQIALATNAVMDDLNEVNWNRLSSLRAALVSVNGGSNLEDPV